ncbi:hypothetical protein [Ideonella sp.]|jgi:hypothetical protein|uniref:hypothetical protein n=1 Tax=Ideonella sp. TaxID=1929293 RepID=UPI0037BF6D5E
MKSSTSFNLEKLKNKDQSEIRKVAQLYSNKKLSSGQISLINSQAKHALQEIRNIAKLASKSQVEAFKSNDRTTQKTLDFSSSIAKNSKGRGKLREGYKHAEIVQRQQLSSNEIINDSNNQFWGKVVSTLSFTALAAYVINVASNKTKK